MTAIGASFMDAVYYTCKGLGTYLLGSKVGELAVTAGIAAGSAALGATIFGTTIGFFWRACNRLWSNCFSWYCGSSSNLLFRRSD